MKQACCEVNKADSDKQSLSDESYHFDFMEERTKSNLVFSDIKNLPKRRRLFTKRESITVKRRFSLEEDIQLLLRSRGYTNEHLAMVLPKLDLSDRRVKEHEELDLKVQYEAKEQRLFAVNKTVSKVKKIKKPKLFNLRYDPINNSVLDRRVKSLKTFWIGKTVTYPFTLDKNDNGTRYKDLSNKLISLSDRACPF